MPLSAPKHPILDLVTIKKCHRQGRLRPRNCIPFGLLRRGSPRYGTPQFTNELPCEIRHSSNHLKNREPIGATLNLSEASHGPPRLCTKCSGTDTIQGLQLRYAPIEWRAHSTIAAVMRIQIASDLHLEMHNDRYPPLVDFVPVADRDVLVLAGDIGVYTQAVRFIEDEARISPVIYVPGNHEYHTNWGRRATDDFWQEIADETPDLYYLNGDGVTINGVRFWGAPWYSDLRGRRDPVYLRIIEASIKDFSEHCNDNGRWTVRQHIEEYAHQTELLREQADCVDVVVTHWPPTDRATPPRFRDGMLNGYFVNDRESLVETIGARLWISGHVHDPYDCMVGATRCIGNPCGYPGEVPEAGGFRADRVVDVSGP